MPRTKYGRRTTRRVARPRKYRKYNKQKYTNYKIKRMPLAGMPDKRFVKLRYTEQFVLTSTSGATAKQVFRCGSIFDPDLTGTGHQPLGHDEWSVLYNYYRVLGSKITVQPINSSAVPGCICIFKNDDQSGPATGIAGIIEQGRCTWRMLAEDNANPPQTMVMKYSAKREFPMLYKDDSLRATFGSNPGEDKYYIVALQALDGTSTISVPCLINIEYLCELSSPTVLIQS